MGIDFDSLDKEEVIKNLIAENNRLHTNKEYVIAEIEERIEEITIKGSIFYDTKEELKQVLRWLGKE